MERLFVLVSKFAGEELIADMFTGADEIEFRKMGDVLVDNTDRRTVRTITTLTIRQLSYFKHILECTVCEDSTLFQLFIYDDFLY